MICGRCHSRRIIRFIDGFGSPRMFCRSCHNSVKMTRAVVAASQRRLMEFSKRWEDARIKDVSGSFAGR